MPSHVFAVAKTSRLNDPAIVGNPFFITDTTMKHSAICLLIVVFSQPMSSGQTPERKFYFPPEKVSVLPILHVPKGLSAPDDSIAKMIYRHVEWSRDRYKELLGTTFEIAEPKTLLYRGRYTLDEYRTFDNKAFGIITAQHLTHLNVNRFNCPYVLFNVLYNPKDGFPFGRGGSMNGGFNTGGGAVLMSSFSFTDRPNAQSTMQHELAHAFGLPHVDRYGYQLRGDSPSIMAYNPKHHTNRFKASDTPGIFIPEDIRGLALNDRALPNLKFDPAKHVPAGYEMKGRIVSNSAGIYPESLDYKIEASTNAGEAFRSRIENVALGRIDPSPGPEITYDQRSMWHSDAVDEEANIDLKFPFAVELSSMRIYSGHSEQYHEAASVRLLVPGEGQEFREVAAQKFRDFDEEVKFPATDSRSWRLALTSGSSRKIVIRGIRFYSGKTEIFRPQICLVEP